MTYILFYKGSVYGCYGCVDVLRLNCLIIIFRLLEKNLMNKIDYENLSDYLSVDNFTINNFDISEFKTLLRNIDIRIEKVVHENNGSCALEHILEHLEYRFDTLEETMKKDSRIKVKIPGNNPREHAVGTMYKEQWKLIDEKNYEKLFKAMYDYIAERLGRLENKYKKRVSFGDVVYQDANENNYQVWSANAVNWNRPEGMDIPGCYQAQEMKFQEPGVYGIVVTPRYGYKNLVPKDITSL